MKPNNFTNHPYDSVLKNTESEIVARNIMKILERTGNEFRLLGWDEYKAERIKDGSFTESEKTYFDKVVGFCISEHSASAFCANWASE